MATGIAAYLRQKAQELSKLAAQSKETAMAERLNCMADEFMEKATQLETLFTIQPA